MSDQAIVERADLQKKDKSELQTIVEALGGKATSRAKKADLIDQVLELSGVVSNTPAAEAEPAAEEAAPAADSAAEAAGTDPRGGEAASSDEASSAENQNAAPDASQSAEAEPASQRPRGRGNEGDRGGRSRRGRNAKPAEPPAEWEVELEQKSGGQNQGGQNQGGQRRQKSDDQSGQKSGGQNQGGQNQNDPNAKTARDEDPDQSNRRRRRRGRSRDRDDEGPATLDPVAVSGFLELRDDGYGFLRVNGWMQSKEDVYVPVKLVRQLGLRRGDLVTGTARPATRNEKNPALDTVETINGLDPAAAKERPDFDQLTPLFPDERLRLELTREPLQATPRIVDLVAPIGKGQRGLIVSPPKAGKTTIMKDIAKSIEKNHPEVHLVVLLIDERPEEVTDMARSLENSEVVASTFDRPPEEHCALAELTIERAKRMVEGGEDVVIILDGITRLARAYNMAGPGSGRLMSGGLDTAAIYPPKRFFGAARNLEEGGSLTILATALVETGSKMDEVIFEEFKGTGNMELRLDRRLAEKRIFPAIDIDASSTRRDELLYERTERNQAVKLRRVLSAMGGDDAPGAAVELLVDRLKSFKTNEAFLQEIAKNPG